MGNEIILSNEEIKQYISTSPSFISSGTYGEVYKFNDNLCLKLWDRNLYLFDFYHNINNLLKNKVQTEHFITPLSAVYFSDDNNRMMGYTMRFIEGKELYYEFLKINFEKLLNQLISLKNEIKILSKKRILLEDINIGNILYNETDGLFFIDPDYWQVLPNSSYKEILKFNERKIITAIDNKFSQEIKMQSFMQNNKNLAKNYSYTESMDSYYEYLNVLKKELEKIGEEKVETFYDAKRLICDLIR